MAAGRKLVGGRGTPSYTQQKQSRNGYECKKGAHLTLVAKARFHEMWSQSEIEGMEVGQVTDS